MDIWTPVLVLVGTLGGAALGPLFARSNRRADAQAAALVKRETAIGKLVPALMDAALFAEPTMQKGSERTTIDQLHKAQMGLSLCLRNGEGQVDEYVAGIVRTISKAQGVSERVAIANHGGQRLLLWLRGELKSRSLLPFQVSMTGNGNGFNIRELAEWPAY